MGLIGVQFDIAWEDKPANGNAVKRLLSEADVAPSSLIVLPEMFATGFTMDVASVGEACDGLAHALAAELAVKYRSFVVAGIATLAPGGRGRNEAVVYGADGREVARYCKLHPFSYAGETAHYDPGEDLVLFEWGGFTVAPLICYDLRFPETFVEATRRGADLFVVIASWPAQRRRHWSTLLAARAIENQAYVVGVNRCGSDPNCAYAGDSVILDPAGVALASAAGAECVLTAAPDRPSLQEYRRLFPVLQDRRRDL